MTRTKLSSYLLLTVFMLSGCSDLFIPRQGLQPRAQITTQQSNTAQKTNEKTVVGVLLPLSGSAKDAGKSCLDAAKMAVFDLRASDIILKPYDTAGDANKARANAKAVLAEGAEIILGPVFSSDTRAITPLTQAENVPVLSLSNTPEIARQGIYPLGYNPADQTRSVAQHLLSQGKENFAVFAPNTRYTKLAVNALKNTIDGQARLVREIYYDKSARKLDSHINLLIPQETSVDFDALFIPERGDKLTRITQALRAKGLTPDRVQFFGPDSWKDMSSETCQILKRGTYASADLLEMEKFKDRFQKTYGYCPSDIASIAYDMVALIVSLSRGNQKITNQLLTRSTGFKGIDGPFRLMPEGKVERNYAVYEVGETGPQTILPPARDF